MELNVNPEVTLRQKFVRLAIITTLTGGLLSLLLFTIFNVTSSTDSNAGIGTANQICITVSDSKNKIYKFKLSDGSVLSSKDLSSASSVEAATLNLKGDTFWMLNKDELHYSLVSGSMSNTKVSGSNISAQKLTGALGDKYISDFDAMSVDINGDLWAGSSDNSPLLMVVIDRSTGNVKEDYFGAGVDYMEVDNSLYSALRFDAMAFDPITNDLYANMNGSSYNYDYLFKINTSNGEMTLVRQFNTIDDVEGMGFDEEGNLFVVTGSNASSSSLDNTMWHVDLMNGEVTKMFALWGGDMETCDCIMGDPITANEISGYVFYDSNKDTTFGTGDVGKNNFTVYLYSDVNGNGQYNAGTDVLLESTNTYSDGYYQFRRTYSTGTEKYIIFADTGDLPDNSYLTTNNIETAVFSSGQNIDSLNNFGFATDSTKYFNIIKGIVYADANENASYEFHEDLVSGVEVKLYSDLNCNNSVDGSDQLLESAIVGMDGAYSFIQSYSSSTVCYTLKIDVNTVPSGSSLTTDNLEIASFSSGGNTDSMNNFGVWGGALPVTWLRFTGEFVGDVVELNWATGSEDNNSHFEIERSSDALNWELIGQQNGAGTSTEVSTYMGVDQSPFKGLNYYRIKQVDFNGDYDYSNTIVLGKEMAGKNLKLNLFPNPAKDFVAVSWNKQHRNATIELLDLGGRVLASTKATQGGNTVRFDLSNYDKGVYFIRYTAGQYTSSEKLVVYR